jgi:hypothetical protein
LRCFRFFVNLRHDETGDAPFYADVMTVAGAFSPLKTVNTFGSEIVEFR